LKIISPYNTFCFFAAVTTGFVLAINVDVGLRYNYHRYVDDMLSIDVFQNYGILKGTFHLFSTISGRLVSFFFSLLLTPVLIGGGKWMSVLYILNTLIFVFALSIFLKSLFEKRYAINLNTKNALLLSGCLYGLFYLFSFDKRYEFWYWFSATVVYEYSIVLMLLMLGLLLGKDSSRLDSAFVLAASACLGFMAETHAVIMLLIFIGFALNTFPNNSNAISRKFYVTAFAALLLLLSLAANYFSAGNSSKMHITKTNLLDVVSLKKAVLVLYNDWFLKWESVSWRIFEGFEVKAILLRMLCVLMLALLAYLFLKSQSHRQKTDTTKTNAYLLLGLGIAIFVSSYFISAWLYANMADRIVDRCKFIGYFAFYIGLFDFFIFRFVRKRAAAI
jgi:hypothetical protein